MDALFLRTGVQILGTSIISPETHAVQSLSSRSGSAGTASAISVEKKETRRLSGGFNFNYPFRSLFGGGGERKEQREGGGGGAAGVTSLEDVVLEEEGSLGNEGEKDGQNGNWVLKVFPVWSGEKEVEKEGQSGNLEINDDGEGKGKVCDSDDGECKMCDYDDDDDENNEKRKIEFDRKSFSKLLKKVSLGDAKLYAQLSYLGNLAYCIPNIKPKVLLKRYGLRFITSSIEKREQLEREQLEKEKLSNAEAGESVETDIVDKLAQTSEDNKLAQTSECTDKNTDGSKVSASAAIEIVASVASYLHTQTKTILPFGSSKSGEETADGASSANFKKSEAAPSMAVVAAEEEVKQAVADDLNSVSSSPCEWYVCDDDKSATRVFVIQGSETLASWKANLFFEPINFEGMDVFVHRGIYEAAKGMYQQMLPEVHAHLKNHGRHAKFRFTGHSLGGSLSLLINLMLLVRGEVPLASLLPVITFGSPTITCGGNYLLRKLGLPKSHVQAVVMHRDIVPRAFSCEYPRPAAEILKAVNGKFRSHPCLNNQKLLYAPMGEMVILQPDAKYSPQHNLLPSGSGLYILTCKAVDVKEAEKQLQAAKKTFLNVPHPVEILSDRSAYGNGGSIQRDHDMNSYLKCLRGVIRQELSRIRKAERERRRKVWWPLVTPRVIVGTTMAPSNTGRVQFNFSGIMRTGRESFKRFSRLVASQHMHLLVVLLFPARMLLIGAYGVINTH